MPKEIPNIVAKKPLGIIIHIRETVQSLLGFLYVFGLLTLCPLNLLEDVLFHVYWIAKELAVDLLTEYLAFNKLNVFLLHVDK